MWYIIKRISKVSVDVKQPNQSYLVQYVQSNETRYGTLQENSRVFTLSLSVKYYVKQWSIHLPNGSLDFMERCGFRRRLELTTMCFTHNVFHYLERFHSVKKTQINILILSLNLFPYDSEDFPGYQMV